MMYKIWQRTPFANVSCVNVPRLAIASRPDSTIWVNCFDYHQALKLFQKAELRTQSTQSFNTPSMHVLRGMHMFLNRKI